MEPTVIGTIDLPTKRYRIDSEVACWYHEIDVVAGTHNVIASNPHSFVELRVHVEGPVTEAYTASLLCGVPVGSSPQYKDHPDVGRVMGKVIRANVDDVTLNDDGRSMIAKYWIVSPAASEFTGHGLKVVNQTQLVPIKEVWHHEYRIDPNNGGLTEFVDDAITLAARVNALQAEGADPDVWRMVYGADRKPWFETPLQDHRPYNQHKFNRPGRSEDGWRWHRDRRDPAALGKSR